MTNPLNRFNPDYFSPPGNLIRRYMETYNWTTEEFARMCDIAPGDLKSLIAGDMRVTEELAIALEKNLEIDKYIWINMDKAFVAFKRKKSRRSAVGLLYN